MFSVIIPLFNKEKSIQSTLKSVLAQTLQDFEVVIINDGSTDNSLEKVNIFKDGRIRIFNKENGGVSSARNRGIRESKYEWVVFIDADDYWMDNHLETLQQNILKFPEFKVFCNSYKLSNQPTEAHESEKVTVIDNYFKEVLNYHFFWTGVVCLHKNVFNEIGFFDKKLSRGEDLEVWMKLGKKFNIVWSKKITAVYNQESENKATKSSTELEKSLINYLDFSTKDKFERRYLKRLVIMKIKSLVFEKKIGPIFQLLFKYNFKLI